MRREGWASLGRALLLGSLVGSALVVGAVQWVFQGELRAEDYAPGLDSLRIEARDGRLLRESVSATGARREYVSLPEMSPLMIDATIAVEDARFFDHHGVDGRAVARALVQAIGARRVVSGASTITMQLAKLVHARHRRSLSAKLDETVEALRIERRMSKAQILEQYLNRAPYGAGAVGVEAASRRYFGKSSRNLSLAEAALLAGLPKAPSELNPRVAPEKALRRRQTVLERLEVTGRASAEDVARAKREPLALSAEHTEGVGMHFTELAIERGKGLGANGGVLHTTMDLDLESEVEALVAEHVATLRAHGLTHAAVVLIDHRSCEVLAMAGSAGYSEREGAVNGAIALRQPGSTLKPFTYALAIEKGYSPVTVVADIPTRYGEVDGPTFAPKNFDGAFNGPLTVAEALARSLNVPAIRAAGFVGAEVLLAGLRRFGFTSLTEPAAHYGLGLTLGNGEVTLLELTEAYAALARGGVSCAARVLDAESTVAPTQVVSPTTAALVTHVLSDERLRTLAFGRNSVLGFDGEVALKTGTSSDFRDGWTIGFTDKVAIGVWVGDFGGRPMDHLAGVTGAGPLFRQMVETTRRRLKPGPLPKIDGLEQVEVCAASGHQAGEGCPLRRSIVTRRAQVSDEACPFHRALRIDLRNGLLAGESCAAEHVSKRVFEVLPPKFAAWQAASGNTPPTRYSPLCPRAHTAVGGLMVDRPRSGETFVVEPGYPAETQAIELGALVESAPESVSWWVDGVLVAEVGYPYSVEWQLAAGRHRIEVSSGEVTSAPIHFEVR
ncbi:MAG: penicillin-binding protein 1C [Deltaproteobacteria bacterium]|nr:penicillin-binding protein 1C [Deltaproteobacteria bacterium]